MEEAARATMRELAARGDFAGALSAYVALEHRLKAELGVAPSRETQRLLAEIRAQAPPPLHARTPRSAGRTSRP